MIANGEAPEIVNSRPIPKREGFCFNLKINCIQIGRAIKMREIYQVVIFILSLALLNPTFSDFSYFFLLNVVGISKFMFSLLVLLGQICNVIGAIFYKAFCRNIDTRIMVFMSLITSSIGCFLNYCFAKRWNIDWGIPDLVFLFMTDVVFGAINTLLFTLPILALFGKITPPRIEGTTFAFLTGTMNFGSTVISPGIGTFINHEWVGVGKKNLSGYSTLCLVALICSLVSFALLPLIPSKKNIKEWRAKRFIKDNKKL